MRRMKRGCHWQSEIRSGVETLQQTGRSSFAWNWLERLQCFFNLIEIILIRDPELTVYMDTNLSDMHKVVLSAKRSWKYNRRRRSLSSTVLRILNVFIVPSVWIHFTFMFIELTLANVVSLALPVMLLSSSAGTETSHLHCSKSCSLTIALPSDHPWVCWGLKHFCCFDF